MSEVISKTTKVRKGIGLKVVLGIIGGLASGMAISFAITNREWLLYQCKNLVGKAPIAEEQEEVTELEEEGEEYIEESGNENEEGNERIYSPITPKITRLGEELSQELLEKINERFKEIEKNITLLANPPKTPTTGGLTEENVANAAEFSNLKKVIDEQWKEITALKDALNSLRLNQVPAEKEKIYYDLKKLFKKFDVLRPSAINWESNLKLPASSDPDNETQRNEFLAKIFNEVFKKVIEKNKPKSVENPEGIMKFPFPDVVEEYDYTLEEWLITKGFFDPKMKVFENGRWVEKSRAGYPKDNRFDPRNPHQFSNDVTKVKNRQTGQIEYKRKEQNYTQISLATGSGKSTHFPRCLAFRGRDISEFDENPNLEKGVTLVVPNDELAENLRGSHTKWLPNDNSTEEDVIKCKICKKRHTRYEAAVNGPSKWLNILSWPRFLEAYNNEIKRSDWIQNRSGWINEWVIFDEYHTLDLEYQKVLAKFEEKKLKDRGFNMVGVSATHIKGGLPISRKLNGPIHDRYVTDFRSLLKEFPDFFKPVVLVFCDDMSLINLTPFKKKLSEYGIRYKILDVTAKKEATEIVQTFANFGGDSPKLIFLDNAYEAGINFKVSPLNILATGVGSMEITLDRNGNKRTVVGDCTIGSYTQQRGRTSRNSSDPPSVFVALSTVFGNWTTELKKKSWGSEIIDESFKPLTGTEKKQNENDLKAVLKYFKNPPPPKEIDEEQAQENLEIVLIGKLREYFKKWSEIIEEKLGGKAKGGVSLNQFEFNHFLMRYFKCERLKEILISVTDNKVSLTSEKGGYRWYLDTPDDTSDDYLLPEGDTNTSLFGFLFGARINKEEEIEIEPREPGKEKEKIKYEEGYEIVEQTPKSLKIKFNLFDFKKYKEQLVVSEEA